MANDDLEGYSVDVEALSLDDRVVVTSDGKTFPITLMTDANGDETDDLSQVMTILCGSAEMGWFEMDISNIEWPTYH